MANTIGNILKVSIFGESHSESIGLMIDGLPSGICLDMEFIQSEMARRSPGGSAISTARSEADVANIKSGYFEGKTTGTPICAVIDNTDTRSSDYDKNILRPSHADYSGKMRYNSYNDYRGGGHFSGRLTASIVFAGALCKQFLKEQGIEIFAHIKSIYNICDATFNPCMIDREEARKIKNREIPVIDENVIAPMIKNILDAKKAQNSVGGTIECAVCGIKAGLGNPFFESVESRLSSMLFSVPAVKGVEFGLGFDITKIYGDEANDNFCIENAEIKTQTNNSGGINGGITNGMPILFSVAIKPTPSIALLQKTVDISSKTECETQIHGRHDPCIATRTVAVIEAATAITIADLVLEGKAYA